MTDLLMTGLQIIVSVAGQVVKICSDAQSGKVEAEASRARLREMLDKLDAIPHDLRDELHKRLSNAG